jgi:hypothetical protein
MNHRVRSIVEEARKLSPEERRQLLDILEIEFHSVQEGTPQEVEAAWLEEVEKRAARADAGETAPVSLEAAMERARRRIR